MKMLYPIVLYRSIYVQYTSISLESEYMVYAFHFREPLSYWWCKVGNGLAGWMDMAWYGML